MRRLTVFLVLFSLLTMTPVRAATWRRIAGDDRYGTGAAVALDRWTNPSDVFLASGVDPADALAGAFGSGLHSSPVLLTARDSIPKPTLDALHAIKPRLVHILGGTGSVSDAVVTALQSDGYEVKRHAGTDRFGTAAAVARSEGTEIIGTWQNEGKTALLANGRRPFDALAAGPLSAGQLFPILLTETGSLPKVTSDALDELGIDHVIVLGGTAAVSDEVVASLTASGRTVRRVAGSDRMETAVAIAGLLEELGMTPSRAALASATSAVDALGAGPWGAPDTPVVLCETPMFCGIATSTWAHRHDLDELVVVGGTSAVSDVAAMEVASGA